MKTLEQIEKEYQSFKPSSTHITSLKEFIAFIEVGIDDTYDIKKEAKKEIRLDRKYLLETKIRNFIIFLMAQEEVDFYEDDIDIMLEQIDLVNQYREMFMRMLLVSSEENVRELVKLTDFASVYYGQHIDYLEYQRDRLEMRLKGFSLLNPKLEDNREVISEFVNQKLTILEEKEKEKQKQYWKAKQNDRN